MPGPCPNPEQLAIALRGSQSTAEDERLATHLTECAACRMRLEAMAGGYNWLEARAKASADSTTTGSDSLRRAMRKLESLSDGQAAELQSPKIDFLKPSDKPGVLGRFSTYEVLEHVASGGMGIVLKAQDVALNRVVALKILPPSLAANPLARARFVREARAAAAVVHEHVVSIYAVDEWNGLPFIVMQFVHGRSLSERIRLTGPLRLEEILRIGAQTAAGLAAAHAQGLVHRDVKPGNILLENSVERVKLTDFGLARAVDDAGVTKSGELAGTPEFMAPEQAGSERVDSRADLFSLGSVLYMMATGNSPFHARSVIAVVRKVCDEQPPTAHTVNPAVPIWLSDIIARLMEKSPDARFQSASEVGEVLGKYLARVQGGEFEELPESIAARRQASARLRLRQIAWVIGPALVMAILLITSLKVRHSSGNGSNPQAESVTFVVSASDGKSVGSYTTLTEAINAAPASAMVELCWNGPMPLSPLDFESKPLILRAGKGFHPVWQYDGNSGPAIQTHAELTLENIEFEFVGDRPGTPGSRRPPPGNSVQRRINAQEVEPTVFDPNNGPALVTIHNAPLRISHCFFHSQIASQPSLERRKLVELDNSPSCVIQDSALNAIIGRCVVWHQDSVSNSNSLFPNAAVQPCLVLSNSAFFGLSAICFELGEGVNAQTTLTSCTFRGRTTFDIPAAFAAARLSISACNNLVAAGSLIYDERNTPSNVLADWLDWTGKTNFFNVLRGFVTTQDQAHDISNRLDDWILQWGPKVTSPRSGELAFAAGQLRPNAPTSAAPRLHVFEVTNVIVLQGPSIPKEQWHMLGADIREILSKTQ